MSYGMSRCFHGKKFRHCFDIAGIKAQPFPFLVVSLILPMLCRIVRGKKRSLNNPHRNILDGELLSKFAQLGTMEKLEVAKKIGTTPSQVCKPSTFNLSLNPL